MLWKLYNNNPHFHWCSDFAFLVRVIALGFTMHPPSHTGHDRTLCRSVPLHDIPLLYIQYTLQLLMAPHRVLLQALPSWVLPMCTSLWVWWWLSYPSCWALCCARRPGRGLGRSSTAEVSHGQGQSVCIAVQSCALFSPGTTWIMGGLATVLTVHSLIMNHTLWHTV